jgi:hypothetical protein
MANTNDSDIIKGMMRYPEELYAEYFYRVSPLIVDDATYWNVLGTLWKLGGKVKQQELWRPLFLSRRKKRDKIMKKTERQRWRNLPAVIKAFRAVNDSNEAETAISWSLDRKIVERFFSYDGARQIVERTFHKAEVFAFFDRRGEEEILVNLTERRPWGSCPVNKAIDGKGV